MNYFNTVLAAGGALLEDTTATGCRRGYRAGREEVELGIVITTAADEQVTGCRAALAIPLLKYKECKVNNVLISS